MKKDISRSFWEVVILVVVLLLIGEFFLVKTLKRYRQFIIKQQDVALEHVMDSVDSTLDEFCKRYLAELSYVTGRRGFLEAEEVWKNTGDAHELLDRMRENLVAEDENIESIVAIMKGKVFLSTNGKMDYWLPIQSEHEHDLDIVVCSDESLSPYIAFIQYKDDITYAAIMEPVKFYEYIEKSSGLQVMGDMILMDDQHSMFLYRDETAVVADLLSDEGLMENPLLHILFYARMKKTESIDFYEVKEGPYKKAYRARVAICPDQDSINQHFTVGILHNEEEQNEMISKTMIEIFLYGGMILLGIIIILFYLFWIYRQDERNRKEIAVLKQKKEAVEAINAQTMELAHHQRLETIGQLTSGIAHEFNNLLTPIMGYSIMTMENLPPEDSESYDNLLEIYQASNKAKELISRLSDLSRKNTAVTMHYLNPNEVARQAISMANTSKPKPINIKTALLCKEVWLYGNETQLIQMMLNLILNAFHAIGDQEGTVSISDYVNGDQICYDIQDSGKGIPKENLEKIFQPFFTTKDKGHGTGLGLAIVMQTVEEHKGKITVDSEEGNGTTFHISFPMVKMEDEEE